MAIPSPVFEKPLKLSHLTNQDTSAPKDGWIRGGALFHKSGGFNVCAADVVYMRNVSSADTESIGELE